MKIASALALVLVVGCSEYDEPTVTLTVANDPTVMLYAGDTVNVHATTHGLGSPSFFWTVGGATDATVGPDLAFIVSAAQASAASIEVVVTAAGADEDNVNVRLTASATVVVDPAAFPQAPVAVADHFAVQQNDVLNASVALNDPVAGAGETRSFALTSDVAHGTLVFDGTDGTFTYTPTADFVGDDGFTYTLTIADLTSEPTTVSISVTTLSNQAPEVQPDFYSVNEDATLNGVSVLANDTDDNFGGTSLSAVLVSDVAHGSLTLNANGTFTYVPAANFNGQDTFTYVASDGELQSGQAQVTIAVVPQYDAPYANSGTFTTDDATPIQIVLGGSPDSLVVHANLGSLTPGYFFKADVDGNLTSDPVTLQDGQSDAVIWFVPQSGQTGSPVASIQFSITDGATTTQPLSQIDVNVE